MDTSCGCIPAECSCGDDDCIRGLRKNNKPNPPGPNPPGLQNNANANTQGTPLPPDSSAPAPAPAPPPPDTASSAPAQEACNKIATKGKCQARSDCR